jgi:hypothetical protein
VSNTTSRARFLSPCFFFFFSSFLLFFFFFFSLFLLLGVQLYEADCISIQVHGRLVKNASDAACLLARGFEPPPDNAELKTQGEALSCFQVSPSPWME